MGKLEGFYCADLRNFIVQKIETKTNKQTIKKNHRAMRTIAKQLGVTEFLFKINKIGTLKVYPKEKKQ